MKTILTSCHFFKQNNITSTKHLSEAARVKLKKMSAREKVYTQIKKKWVFFHYSEHQQQFYTSCLNFIFLCFKLIISHYHIPKERKIKFKPKLR